MSELRDSNVPLWGLLKVRSYLRDLLLEKSFKFKLVHI
jgi:hypothetical protein